jgi:glycosyltransferase involved in cell wall biosynthesis
VAPSRTVIPLGVSVVIPTHNRPDLLAEALASVLRQTAAPREVIVVDDVPSPATKALVQSMSAAGTTTLRYVSTDPRHRTAGESRNTGATAASGAFLAFLDDDDTWREDHLELLGAAMTPDVSLAASWTRYVRGEASAPGMRLRPGIASGTMSYARNPGFTGSNFLIRSEVFARIGGFDPALRVANDLDLFLRLMDDGVRYAVVREETTWQRAHDRGQLSARTPERAAGLRAFGEKYRDRMSAADRRYLGRQYHSVMRHCADDAARRRAHLLRQAATYSPADYVRLMARFGSGRHQIWATTRGTAP